MADHDTNQSPGAAEPLASASPSLVRPAVLGGLIGLAVFAILFTVLFFGMVAASGWTKSGPTKGAWIVLVGLLVICVGRGVSTGVKGALNRLQKDSPAKQTNRAEPDAAADGGGM